MKCFKCGTGLTPEQLRQGEAFQRWSEYICLSCARKLALTKISCIWCDKKLKASDVDRGLATRVDDEYVCKECRIKLEGPKARPRRSTTRAIPNAPPARRPRKGGGTGVAVLSVAGGVLLAGILFLVLANGGGRETPSPAEPAAAKAPPERAAPKTPAAPAGPSPTDFTARLAALEEKLKRSRGTADFDAARKEYNALMRKHREAVEREGRALEKGLARDVAKGDYDGAGKRLERAAKTMTSEEWDAVVSRRRKELERARFSGSKTFPPPAGPAVRWERIFDGATLECIAASSRDAWRVVDGAIEHVPGTDNSAQSVREFGDGRFRVHFTTNGGELFRFSVRQGPDGSASVLLNAAQLGAIEGATRELIVACKGDSVSALLEGREIGVIGNTRYRTGRFQFNVRGGGIRILAIDFRP